MATYSSVAAVSVFVQIQTSIASVVCGTAVAVSYLLQGCVLNIFLKFVSKRKWFTGDAASRAICVSRGAGKGYALEVQSRGGVLRRKRARLRVACCCNYLLMLFPAHDLFWRYPYAG